VDHFNSCALCGIIARDDADGFRSRENAMSQSAAAGQSPAPILDRLFGLS
jgi:hypothetical protein